METLYHITPKRNLLSIQEHGLLPQYRIGFCTSKWSLERYKGCVFLTDNVGFIAGTQLTNEWIDNALVIVVNVKGLKLERWFAGAMREQDHEYIVRRPIHKSRILGWEALNPRYRVTWPFVMEEWRL